MKGNIILMILALVTAIGGGIFMNQSFADQTYSFANIQTPQSCVCSAPVDLKTNASHLDSFKSSFKARTEPPFLMSLYNCQCGDMTCSVSTRAISCIK